MVSLWGYPGDGPHQVIRFRTEPWDCGAFTVFTIPMILAAINCMAVEHGVGSKAFPTVLRFGGSHICCISMRVDFLCSPIRATLSKRIPSCDSQMSSFPNFQARGGFGQPPLRDCNSVNNGHSQYCINHESEPLSTMAMTIANGMLNQHLTMVLVIN